MPSENKCTSCGYCCIAVHHYIPYSKENLGWVRARGFKIIQASDKIIEIRMADQPCPQLENAPSLEDGYTCKINNSKPKACKQYPDQVFALARKFNIDPYKSLGPNCGFRNNTTDADRLQKN